MVCPTKQTAVAYSSRRLSVPTAFDVVCLCAEWCGTCRDYRAAFAELQQAVSDLPQVSFINDFLTRQQTWDLQACCDVLLSLHRAEGFGLAPAEMMASEAIVTRRSPYLICSAAANGPTSP